MREKEGNKEVETWYTVYVIMTYVHDKPHANYVMNILTVLHDHKLL